MDLYYKVKREDDNSLLQEDCLKSSRSMKSGAGPERRLKRQIANSNERKRMQTINAGFQSLRLLLPTTEERLSKAAILQQAVDYITQLLVERQHLLKRVTISPESRQTSPITATVYPTMAKPTRSEPLTLRNVAVSASNQNVKQTDSNQFRKRDKLDRDAKSPKKDEGENKVVEFSSSEDAYELSRFYPKLSQSQEQRVPHPESDLYTAALLNSSVSPHHANTQPLTDNYAHEDSTLRPRLLLTGQPIKTVHRHVDSASQPTLYTQACTEPVYMQVGPASQAALYTQACTEPVFLAPTGASSLSRRNLETIFEAIRHLEGGGRSDEFAIGRMYAGHSEESGHESYASDDDLNEPKIKAVKMLK